MTAKNVNRILKEKSGESLKHLGMLRKDMANIDITRSMDDLLGQIKSRETQKPRIQEKRTGSPEVEGKRPPSIEHKLELVARRLESVRNRMNRKEAIEIQLDDEKDNTPKNRREKRKEISPMEQREGKETRKKNIEEEEVTRRGHQEINIESSSEAERTQEKWEIMENKKKRGREKRKEKDQEEINRQGRGKWKYKARLLHLN